MPFTVLVVTVQLPIESTVTSKVTLLEAVTAVPAVNVPDSIAPVHDPVPPAKLYSAEPPAEPPPFPTPGAPPFSKLPSRSQETNNNERNKIVVIKSS